jgi:hypothetical protein
VTLQVDLTPPFRELVDGVRDFLQDHGVSTVVERGWKAREKIINQGPGRANRVIFAGSKPGGDAGVIVGPRQVGQRTLRDEDGVPQGYMRSLGDWRRVVFVSVWAYDGDKPNDEGAQDDALYQLFLWTMRAVHAVTFGNGVWGAIAVTVPVERGFGLELRTDLTFQHQMPELPDELAFPAGEVVRPPAVPTP